MVRAKYPGAYDDLDDASLDRMVRQKYPGAYDDIPAKSETKDEAALRLANSRFTVNPDLEPWKRRAGAFVDRGVEMAKGLGSLGLDAAKSALTLEGQVGFLPRMAKNAYEGMIDSSAEAINRQTSPERKGLAAVPVIGPYAMNVLSDYEEGKGPEAEGRMAFDALSMLVPGSKAGRGATGAAIRLADGKILKPITKGLKPLVKRGAEMGVEMAPEAIGAVAGGALGGPTGAAAGALSGKALKDAYRAVKDNAPAPKVPATAPIPRPKASAEQIKAAVEAGPRGNAAKRAMREAKEAKAAKAAEAQAKKDAGKAKFEAAKEAAKPKADKPPTVTVPGETGPRVVSKAEEASERRPGLPQPDPSKVVAGKDPFKLGNRVYSAPEGAKRTRISEHYAINPDIALAEGATGVHPTLGLPMRADGKVLVRNVEEFSDSPGRAPRGAPVWRDPDARFGNNQTVNEVAQMLEARSSTPTSIADLQKQLESAMKRESAPEKTPAQAKFDKAKSDRLMKQVDEAISPNAAYEILKKHGIEGKKIPDSDARAIVDAVWTKKDPTYQSIEQWMDARKEKWNKMRHKKGTP